MRGKQKDNENLYDEIIQSVWSGTVNVTKLKNRLIKREIPENGFDEIPKRTFAFSGVEIDWELQNKSFADIGKFGEELVIEYEKRKLNEEGKENYVNDVKKVKEIMDSWKKNKRIEQPVMVQILNAILTKANIQALNRSQDLNLPAPLQLPKVNVKEPKK